MLDGTVVSVALPTIQRDLGGGLAGQQWITNAYLLTLGSLILIGGSLGDIFGERRIFTIGVAGFGAASLLCALAPSIGVLIAARALQGVAGALLTPSSLAVIVATFDDAERGAAIGTWTAWGDRQRDRPARRGRAARDRLLALAVPDQPAARRDHDRADPRRDPGLGAPIGGRRKIDFAGAALCAGGLAGVAFALIEAPRLGWSSPASTPARWPAWSLLAGFLVRERLAADPMLPLSLFRRRNFSAATSRRSSSTAAWRLFFFLVLFLQQVRRLLAVAERALGASRDDHPVRCSHAASARSRAGSGRGGSWPRDR